MYRLLLIGTAAVAVLTTASLMPNLAAAIPLSGQADIPLALKQVNPIEKVALCFYLDGWERPWSVSVRLSPPSRRGLRAPRGAP